MKRIVIAAVVATFGLAPAIGFACEYNDASMASANSAQQPGLQPAPQASKASVPTVAKAVAPKAAKQAQARTATPATDANLAVANNR